MKGMILVVLIETIFSHRIVIKQCNVLFGGEMK